MNNVNNNTRIYLEAVSYLTLCYIRIGDKKNAFILMPQISKFDKIIKSNAQRNKFKNTILKKIQEESAFNLLQKEIIDKTEIDWDKIMNEAQYLIQTKTEDEIYWIIGNSLPENIKSSFYDFNKTAVKLLNPNNTKLLKNPSDSEETKELGKTFFSSFKVVLHNSLCNPDSEIYKAWFDGAVRKLINPSTIVRVVGTAISLTGIGLNILLIPICALIIKFGVEVYCERYKPVHLLDAR